MAHIWMAEGHTVGSAGGMIALGWYWKAVRLFLPTGAIALFAT